MIVIKASSVVADKLKEHGARTVETEIGQHAVTFNKEEKLPKEKPVKVKKERKSVQKREALKKEVVRVSEKQDKKMTVAELFKKRRIYCAKCKTLIQYSKEIVTVDSHKNPVITCKCGQTRTLRTVSL